MKKLFSSDNLNEIITKKLNTLELKKV
jgi:hypothetical protein